MKLTIRYVDQTNGSTSANQTGIDHKMKQSAHSTGHIASTDVRIHYRHFPAPNNVGGALPVLKVHGLSYFSYDWIGIATELSRQREVVAIDMRGFGESDSSPSGDYGLQAMSGDIVAVLDFFNWKQAALVGHSMGGRVCLCAAAWHPSRVGALICVDFAPDVEAEGRRKVAQRIGNQPDRFASVEEAMAYHGHPGEAPGTPLYQRYQAFLRSTGNGLVLKRDLHYRDNFCEVLRTGKSQPPGVDLWDLVKGLSMPALVLRGSTSDMLSSATLAKVRDTNPSVDTLEIAGSHDLMADNPSGVIQAVTGVLAGR